jgi:uncharacterized damage-inducible protein DinB
MGGLMIPADMLDLFRYNAWANERIISSVRRLPREALTHDLGGSFPTIRGTLAHIVSAEWVWLQRWMGISPEAAPGWVASADLDQLVSRLHEVQAKRNVFMAGLSESDLNASCSFTLLSGKAASHPLQDLFIHVTNHATYHPGQMAAMLRRLGTPALSTDFLIYRSEAQP